MKNRSFFGIVLVLLGLGFLLDQFSIISFSVATYWPVILIVIGLVGLIKNRASKTLNGLLVLFGLLFQARNLGLINVSIYKVFWPVILIVIGLNIIFAKNKIFISRGVHSSKGDSNNMSLEDYIDETVIMGGINTKLVSQEFKGGKITAIMGGVDLDLREAKLYNDEATLNVDLIMGGVDIFVPENWKIKHSGTPIMGGFSNKNRAISQADGPVLNIKFSAIMGGIEIK